MLRLRRARLRLAVLRRLRPADSEHAPDAGFTLIEAIVAVTILGIIAVFASQLVMTSIKASTTSDERQTAVAIATMQMESVRGDDPAPMAVARIGVPAAQGVQTSALFTGRPKSLQLDLFDPTKDTAAASVADVLANTYPEWDPTVAVDSHFAASNAVVPPSGVATDVDGSGNTVYRDGNGQQVYPTGTLDSFQSAVWSSDAAHANPIVLVFHQVGTTVVAGVTTKVWQTSTTPVQTITTNVPAWTSGPYAGMLTQSAVAGYPGGQITLNGTQFTTTILLGSCYVQSDAAHLANATNGVCGKQPTALAAAGVSAPSSSSPYNAEPLPSVIAGYTKLIRVIVIVQWNGISCPVGGAACSYALTSEYLPNIKDLTWRVS